MALIVTPAWADPVPLRDAVPHITTTGFATLEVVPDQADISLGVHTDRPTAEDAAAVTAKAASDVIAAIKARGIAAKDIKTTFDLVAKYETTTDAVTHATRQTLRGYEATEGITVRVRDIEKAGGLARELIEKGANSFRSIDYSYSKEKGARRQLDGEAIRDALASAKTYTDAIGLTLGRVVQIGEDPSRPDGEADLPSRRAPPTFGVAIPTEPGVKVLEETVSVIWEIEGKAR